MSAADGPELRIGDQEREAAISALGEHYASGRLTKEEYDERAEQAFAARTSSALWPLFADLPRPEAARPAAPTAGPGRSERGHQGWWLGARMAPVLMVVVALVVLAHAPFILLLLVGWFVFARTTGHWGRGDRARWSSVHHPR